jgi:hypothetical protein
LEAARRFCGRFALQLPNTVVDSQSRIERASQPAPLATADEPANVLRAMRLSHSGSRRPWLGSSRTSAAACLFALPLAACGSKRLETAFAPAATAGTGSVAGSGGAAADGSAAEAGAAGAPGPLSTEQLVTLADFPDSYTVGPINAERFQISGPGFVDAWRATMNEPPSTPWVAQLVVPLKRPVQSGQLLHVSFWMSCEAAGAAGDCYTEYIFERASDPWEKSVTFPVHAQQTWVQKSEYFSVVDSYAAGVAHMVFRLGYASQVIAIGGVELEAIDAAP